MTKKKVFVTALMVCLIATLSMGSLAWFSASDKVTNKFMIASSDGTGSAESIFSVDVWEVVDTNYDGVSGVVGEGKGDGSTTAIYDAILPGSTYVKAPHVENTGAYDQFIRVVVTISDAAAWLNAAGQDIDMSTVFNGFDETKWNHITKTIDSDTITYVLYANEILQPGQDITLFESVTIPQTLTQQQAAAFGTDGFYIDIEAHAVQTGATGADAVTAFTTVGWPL